MAGLPPELRYIEYEHALEKKYLPAIRALISKDLSEPYSIYVYRYFLYQWGELCFMVLISNPSSGGRCLGKLTPQIGSRSQDRHDDWRSGLQT